MGRIKKRSGSPSKKTKLSPPKDYEEWTNSFQRSTIYWDRGNQILEQDKKGKKRFKLTDRCCGNSPNKSHAHVHDTDVKGDRVSVYSASQNSRFYKPFTEAKPKNLGVKRKSTAQKIINIETPQTVSPNLSKQELISSKELKKMAAKIATVL